MVNDVNMCSLVFFFFQAEDGIRDLVRSRGLGDVYKRQLEVGAQTVDDLLLNLLGHIRAEGLAHAHNVLGSPCLLYTSDAADERSSVDLGGRRIIQKKQKKKTHKSITHRASRTGHVCPVEQPYPQC